MTKTQETQLLWEDYLKDIDSNWQKMWFLVIEVCHAQILKYCKLHRLSFTNEYIYESEVEAASIIMDRIKRNKIPRLIVTYCYLTTLFVLVNVKKKNQDKEEQSSEIFNDFLNGNEYSDNFLKEIAKAEFNKRTHFFADDNDIVYLINGNTYCCLQRDNDCNNVLVQVIKPRVTTFKDILMFFYILYKVYNIRYVSIYLENPIWKKVLKHFFLLQDDRDDKQYYADLSKNMKEIKRRLKNEI